MTSTTRRTNSGRRHRGRPAQRAGRTPLTEFKSAASGSFPYGPVTIGASFLALFALTAAGFVLHYRRRRALSR